MGAGLYAAVMHFVRLWRLSSRSAVMLGTLCSYLPSLAWSACWASWGLAIVIWRLSLVLPQLALRLASGEGEGVCKLGCIHTPDCSALPGFSP